MSICPTVFSPATLSHLDLDMEKVGSWNHPTLEYLAGAFQRQL